MSTTQQPEALRDARWYMIDKDGMATLCTDREDAEKEAKDANMAWPHTAPHRAVQLVEAADVEALRTGYDAARLEIESLHAQLEAIGAGGVEPLRRRECLHQISEPAGEYPPLPVPDGALDHRVVPALGFSADQMRAYVDADRKARAKAAPDVSGYVAEWRGGICTAEEAMQGIAKLYAAQAAPAAPAAARDVAQAGIDAVKQWASKPYNAGAVR